MKYVLQHTTAEIGGSPSVLRQRNRAAEEMGDDVRERRPSGRQSLHGLPYAVCYQRNLRKPHPAPRPMPRPNPRPPHATPGATLP